MSERQEAYDEDDDEADRDGYFYGDGPITWSERCWVPAGPVSEPEITTRDDERHGYNPA